MKLNIFTIEKQVKPDNEIQRTDDIILLGEERTILSNENKR